MIFLEENQLAPAPEVSSFNITMLGPVLTDVRTLDLWSKNLQEHRDEAREYEQWQQRRSNKQRSGLN